MTRTSARALALGLTALGLGVGCGQRPSDLCHQYVGEWQAAIDRCEVSLVTSPSPHFEVVPGGTPWTFVILHPETRDPVSCDNIGRVNNIAEVRRVCYPWLQSFPGTMTCDDLAFALNNGAYPPECSAMHFEILVGT